MDITILTGTIAASILAVISLYHLQIYIERRKYEKEKYNLYFSFFVLCTLLYNSQISLMDSISQMNICVYTSMEALLICTLIYSMIRFLVEFLQYPDPKHWSILYIYISSIFCFLLTFIRFFDEKLYRNNFYYFVVIVLALNVLVMIATFSLWVYRQKLLQIRYIRIVCIGFVILALNILGFRVYMAMSNISCFYLSNIMTSFLLLIFAFALSVKFNSEYEELETLKNELEKKVAQRTNDLLNAKKEVELASEQKTNFFINLAHETKTPLTLIGNYLKSYVKKYGTNKEISIISQNIAKLQQDMLHFLDSEKLAKGFNLFNHQQLTNISSLTMTKLTLFDDYATTQGIGIQSGIEPDLYCMADPRAIDRVLNNLLDNALKYSGKGDTVTCNVCKNKEWIEITIKDTGCGIPPDEQQNLFKPNYQMSTRKLNSQGLGIGLYLTKKILETLHSNIYIDSAPDKGTMVRFALPYTSGKSNITVPYNVEAISLHSYKNKKEEIHEHNILKKSVILAEDNLELLEYLRIELTEYYNVYPAQNGIEVIKMLEKTGNPDLIISDIMMDKMDGHELLEFLQNSERYTSIPVIFLTARTSKESELQAIRGGVVDYIRKPFELEELLVKVNAILNYARKIKKGTSMPTSTNESEDKSAINQPLFEQNCRRYNLTNRQIEIAAMILKGLKYLDIAEKLNLSYRTVIRHVQNIYQKVGINNKLQLYRQLSRPERL